MALIECKECNTTYSDKAEVCPKCACPTTFNISDMNINEMYSNDIIDNRICEYRYSYWCDLRAEAARELLFMVIIWKVKRFFVPMLNHM